MSTISKVAARAGVSRTTVSHVLNHADRVSPVLRERVRQAIDELGYRPNPQAQSLRTGRTNIIALLIPDITNPFYTELVKTIQTRLGSFGLDTLIFNTDVPGGHAHEHARQYMGQIGRKRVDGVIVADFALHGMHDALLKLDVPAVFVGHLPNHAVDAVKIDDYGGGYLMGQYLARKGHKRVVHVTGPAFFEEARSRANGFERGLADNGAPLDDDLRFEGSYLQPSGREAAAWMLEKFGTNMPSAVFFANYLMASGALTEFHDRGIRVPDDIAVAVYDDLPQLEYVRPRLTRVGNSPSVLALRAVTMLIERLNGKKHEDARTEIVPCVLHEYDTA